MNIDSLNSSIMNNASAVQNQATKVAEAEKTYEKDPQKLLSELKKINDETELLKEIKKQKEDQRTKQYTPAR